MYGYPLVLMDVTRAKMTNVPSPAGTIAPMDQFANVRAFPDATFTDVVSPNADTLYSIAWLDLEQGTDCDERSGYAWALLPDGDAGWVDECVCIAGKADDRNGQRKLCHHRAGLVGHLAGRGEGNQVSDGAGMDHRKDADEWQGRLCGRACDSGWVQADSTERVGQAVYSAEGRAG